jgi:hypothetical protein
MSTGPTSAETTALLLESPRLLSVDEYHRMIEVGIFDEDEHVELLEGVVVAMTPQSPTNGVYRRARTVTTADTLTSEALPELSFAVADIFG